MLAAELGMTGRDPRRNLIPPTAFPYETPTEAVYDTGEYELALDKALDIAGYERSARGAGGPVASAATACSSASASASTSR